MMNLSEGTGSRFQPGFSRRVFLRIGSLGIGGLNLPNLLRAEEETGSRNTHKSVIMIFLAGGPPHLDTFDLKPDAPVEIRGEFTPIQTNVPGVQVCELMPRLADIMDKAAILRTVSSWNDHAAFHCLTGRPRSTQISAAQQPAGGWPSLGSVLSKINGPTRPSVPPFVSLTPKMILETWDDPGSPGFLGLGHAPLRPTGFALRNMVLHGTGPNNLNERKALLNQFDAFRRELDTSDTARGMDAFTKRALGILTSSTLVDALDVSREEPRVRRLYGQGRPKLEASSNDDYPATGDLEHFLMARRLVEAGVRCVTLNFGKYDWHSNNFREAKKTLPLLDRGVAALIKDIHDRGLDKDVSVIVWGEFGRSPRINTNNGGRDHWPEAMSVLLSGGGMKMGQVIGSTNHLGEFAKERPIQLLEVFATLYHNLGISPKQLEFMDQAGRPQSLLDGHLPIKELVS